MTIAETIQSEADASQPGAVDAISLAYALPGGLAMYVTEGAWQYARHFVHIEDVLLDVVEGKLKRVIISIPPQHGKSTFISNYFTAWYLGRFPDRKIILASYEATFAASWGRKTRDVLEQHGDRIFGVKISQSSGAADNWEIQGRAGGMVTAGAGGPITGRGADVFVIDDPIKNHREALSKTTQDHIWDWWMSVVRTRLSPTGAVVVVMTRWAYDDIAGRLLKDGEQTGSRWHYIRLPALAEDENDPLCRRPGEALWPERYSREWLLEQRMGMTALWWESLYQQRPSPRTGFMINTDWFNEWTVLPARELVDMCVLSFDTAQKESEIHDYSVCTVWYIYDNHYYLIDLHRVRYDYPKLVQLAKDLHAKWRPNALLIEDKGSGTSLIQTLRRESSAPVIELNPESSKEIRMDTETPTVQAGRVFIPAADVEKPWRVDFLEEVRAFPNVQHKDQVDSMSQFLRWARERSTGIEMW